MVGGGTAVPPTEQKARADVAENVAAKSKDDVKKATDEKVAAEKWRGGDGITNSSGSPSILDNKSNSGFDDPVWSDKPGDDG